MDIMQKLTILTDSAKYDVACTSSGSSRTNNGYGMGNAVNCGICHTFSADGRCVSLLKVLFSNVCAYDCKYCVNRKSNDVPRATFTPQELCELTIQFYRRNYIEGLFLSSAVIGTPDNTTELLIKALELLRYKYNFFGYIHAKAIPGTSPDLLNRLGLLADRLSVNIELPSEKSLQTLAPEKTRTAILKPMRQITGRIAQNKAELVKYKSAPKFAPAGQSTQMIIGATPETDYNILTLTEGLYKKFALKRVFFSAYVPVVENSLLPSVDTKPPLLREHRLYQADWLLRYYNFTADEILSPQTPNFNPYLDPKCNWAINNMHLFPVDVNTADYNELLRVPGIGVKSAKRIITARRTARLDFAALKRLGVVLKRAQYFILCDGKKNNGVTMSAQNTVRALLDPAAFGGAQQLSFFDTQCLPPLNSEEAVECLTKAM